MEKKTFLPNATAVVVQNTTLYNDRKGVIEDPEVRDEEDPWDYNVRLDDGRLIGVYDFQVEPLEF